MLEFVIGSLHSRFNECFVFLCWSMCGHAALACQSCFSSLEFRGSLRSCVNECFLLLEFMGPLRSRVNECFPGFPLLTIVPQNGPFWALSDLVECGQTTGLKSLFWNLESGRFQDFLNFIDSLYYSIEYNRK
uniref:Uncharacterized protein n=1 Tax=Cacopsylla melanoneura TaxID=428564 RepID=A0A8D9E2G9_9HEMI